MGSVIYAIVTIFKNRAITDFYTDRTVVAVREVSAPGGCFAVDARASIPKNPTITDCGNDGGDHIRATCFVAGVVVDARASISRNCTIRDCGNNEGIRNERVGFGACVVIDTMSFIFGNRAITDCRTGGGCIAEVVVDTRATISRNRAITDCRARKAIENTIIIITGNRAIRDIRTSMVVIDTIGICSNYSYRIKLCCICKARGGCIIIIKHIIPSCCKYCFISTYALI